MNDVRMAMTHLLSGRDSEAGFTVENRDAFAVIVSMFTEFRRFIEFIAEISHEDPAVIWRDYCTTRAQVEADA